MGDQLSRLREQQEERETMTIPQPRRRRRKPLDAVGAHVISGIVHIDAGVFGPEIASFRLYLATEGKAAKTVRTYTEAVAWFAAAHLIPPHRSHQVGPGSRARCAAVAGVPAGPVQRCLRQQPVPGAAAVLPVAGGRGRPPGSDGPAARAGGDP